MSYHVYIIILFGDGVIKSQHSCQMAKLESHRWIYIHRHLEMFPSVFCSMKTGCFVQRVLWRHFKPNHDFFPTFGHKYHLVRVGKNIMLWKIVWLFQTWLDVLTSIKNISSGYMLTDVRSLTLQPSHL